MGKRRETIASLAVTLLVASCGPGYGDGNTGLPNNPPGGNPIINVVDFSFAPATLTIAAGTAVTFNWPLGSANHTVVPSTANPGASPASPGGAGAPRDGPFTFHASFGASGTYRFYCSEHGAEAANGEVSGMSGTISVI